MTQIPSVDNTGFIRIIVIAATIAALAIFIWRYTQQESTDQVVLDEIPLPVDTPSIEIEETIVAPLESVESADTTLVEPTAEPMPEPMAEPAETIAPASPVEKTGEVVAEVEQVAEAPATINQEITENEVSEKVEVVASIEPNAAPSPETPAATEPTPPSAEVAEAVDPQTAWLLNADPSHYTLQIVAAQNRDMLKSYIKNADIKTEHAHFAKQVKDKTWYVLVVGDYASRDQAVAAIDHLPRELTKNKPWPIPFSEPQKHLKQAATP